MASTKISFGRQTDLNANSGVISNVGTPVLSTDAATKGYVDAAAVGITWKPAVRVVATTNGALATAYANGQVVDGVTLATGDRILLAGQTTGSENGIYVVAASGAPARASDANSGTNLTTGSAVFVTEGTANDNTGWMLATNGSITVGTTSLTFIQFTGTGEVTVDTTLTKTGNQLSRSAISGDITISAGSNTSAIGANKVTNSQLAQAAASTLKGNPTGSTANVQDLTLDPTLVFSGTTLQRAALSGDVTAAAGSNSTTIAASAVTLAKMANLAANSVIGNLTGSSATPVAVSAVATATASTVVVRDANGNTKSNNFISAATTTATAAGTTTLTVTSTQFQQFTGTTTQTVVLPDATTLVTGQSFTIANRSTGTVTLNANGGGLVQSLAGGSQATVTLIANGTAAGTWDSDYSVTSAGSVTSVSVVSANGFAGTVATASTTPAITISTSVTGVLKGNGTAISAAVASTDYMAPSSFITRETPTGSVNGSNTTFTLANTPLSGTEQVYLNGLLQDPGAGNDYTISGATITYLTAPLSGDKLRVSYQK